MEIKLSRWQTKVWDDTSRFKVINIGRRGGKTMLSVCRTTEFSIKNKNTVVWFIAPTYKQAKLIAWEMFKEVIPSQAIEKTNETELVIILKNGSKIYLKGADNPDSLRGVRIDFAIFDEVAFIDKWEEVWKVVRPTLVDSKAECWFISTPNGYNHFYDLFTNKEYTAFHFTSYDNPYIDKEEIDKAKQEMIDQGQEDSFYQEFMGEFRKMSGLIYKNFDRKIHMVDIPHLDTNYTYTRAIDFGYAHKTALIYFAIAPDGKTIYGYDGVYLSGLTTKEMADIVKTKDTGRVITNPVADSAQPMFIEELQREGVYFNPVTKGQDSVKNGIVKVAELLAVRRDTGKPTLMFNKNLDWIAEEFENYRWIENKSADNSIKEVPYKVNDDAMDAIRYFAMTHRAEHFEDPNKYNEEVPATAW